MAIVVAVDLESVPMNDPGIFERIPERDVDACSGRRAERGIEKRATRPLDLVSQQISGLAQKQRVTHGPRHDGGRALRVE